MLKLQELIRRDIVCALLNSFQFLNSREVCGVMRTILFLYQDKLAINITTEQGKTLKDAHGDVFRGLGCSIISLLLIGFEGNNGGT